MSANTDETPPPPCRPDTKPRPALTGQAAGILLSVAVHLALVTGQYLLHQVQHPEVLHNVVQQHSI